MSYLVLARKWRPQTFEDVIGQGHVVHTLQNAVKKDRLAHAFVFTGARGVGKTTAARLLAKALQCEQGPTPEPCGTCARCLEIADSRAVDVLEIDGASNRGIDQVRELRDGVRYLPQNARFKIVIIDEVHMLTTEAFNALLKTLEEPPPHVKFIFATTEPHKIPVTILSRCQRFDFKRIAPQEIVKHLQKIAGAEGIAADEAALLQVARAAQGSMRDALSLLDQAIAYAEGAITAQVASEALGIIDRRTVVDIIEAVLARDPSAGLDGVQRAYQSGFDLRQLLIELTEELRHLVVARAVLPSGGVRHAPSASGAGPDAFTPGSKVPGHLQALIDLPEREIALVVERAQRTSPEDLQRLFAMALEHIDLVSRADSPRLVLDVLVARMAALPPYRSLDELTALVEQLASGSPPSAAGSPSSRGAPPAPPVRPAPSRAAPARATAPDPPAAAPAVPAGPPAAAAAVSPASEPSASLPGVDARWQAVVDAVRSERPALASFLEHGVVVTTTETALTLRFEQAFYADAVRETDHMKFLLGAARASFPQLSAIKVDVGATLANAGTLSIAEAASRRRHSETSQREAEALEDPTVKLAMQIFGGTVVQVKPNDPS
ncbi:MAG: DNA polymerase III subunit gamma/tau [Pseudomonadota bacterium]